MKDVFSMTDEDFLNLNEPVVSEVTEEESEESTEQVEEVETEEVDTQEEEQQEEAEENQEESQETEETSQEEAKEETEVENSAEESKEEEKETSEEINYKEVYSRIMESPIRANGKEIKLKSVDEAIQLIQMGANYTKKMATLKPHLKLLKALENNSLLNENDINLLIDIKQKKPEAIAKLLADSNINPLDIDLDESAKYKAHGLHTATDQQVELDDVISELQSSDYYGKLSDVVVKNWDAGSKKAIFEKPEILRTLHEHMVPNAEGVSMFDFVSAEVERRKSLGLVKGMTDYEAYINVGNDLYQQHVRQQAQANTEKRVVKPATRPSNVSPQVNKQKEAAAISKAKPAKSSDMDFNPLELPDSEFEKITANHY